MTEFGDYFSNYGDCLDVTLLTLTPTGLKFCSVCADRGNMTIHERAREAYGVNARERQDITERVIFNRPGKVHEELRWAEIGLRGLVQGETAKFMSDKDKDAVISLLSDLQSLRQELQVKLYKR